MYLSFLDDHLSTDMPSTNLKYAALRSPSHLRAGDIEVFLSFHAFRAKTDLEPLSRSQRLFYSMICKLTGLPALTPTSSTSQPDPSPAETTQPTEDLISWSDDPEDDSLRALSRTYSDSPGTSSPRSLPPSIPTTQPSPTSESKSLYPFATQLASQNVLRSIEVPHKIIKTHPTPVKATQRSPFDKRRDSSRSTSSSLSSSASAFATDPSQLVPPAHSDSSPQRQNFLDPFDATHLHTNLRTRLRAFFSQKSEGRQIRVQLYGLCESSRSPARFGGSPRDNNGVMLNHGRPLLTQIVTTRPGGVWAERIVLPWQTIETHLRVHQLQQAQQTPATGLKKDQLGVVQLRVEAQLLPRDSEEIPRELHPMPPSGLNGRHGSFVTDLDVIPSLADAVHVISCVMLFFLITSGPLSSLVSLSGCC